VLNQDTIDDILTPFRNTVAPAAHSPQNQVVDKLAYISTLRSHAAYGTVDCCWSSETSGSPVYSAPSASDGHVQLCLWMLLGGATTCHGVALLPQLLLPLLYVITGRFPPAGP